MWSKKYCIAFGGVNVGILYYPVSTGVQITFSFELLSNPYCYFLNCFCSLRDAADYHPINFTR